VSDPPDARDDRHPPADAEKTHQASTSHQLLHEIQERLERLEGNLALRERRLERFEEEFRAAAARLRTDRAKLDQERGALQQQLADQTREAQKKAEQHAQALQEHQNRAKAATIEKSGAQREKCLVGAMAYPLLTSSIGSAIGRFWPTVAAGFAHRRAL
jgi:FKBP-type peptidyl-prolyl cis-trans isomerase